jgi:RimJ/RimL family protein N-acetyltransferase
VSWQELLAPGVTVWYSSQESARFGLSVSRVTIGPGELDAPHLLRTIDDLASDVVVARFDASRSEVPAVLARGRRSCLAAGALTYWEKLVSASPADPRVISGAEFDLPTLEHAVRDVVRSSFADYGNHYTVDPLLDDAAALAGYEEWALASLAKDPSNVLVLIEDGTPCGVATLEIGDDALEILLAGMVPAAQGRRLYDVLLAGCESRAVELGLGRLIISTQVHNVRAQRAWARCGLRPFGAIETVHLVAPALLRPR